METKKNEMIWYAAYGSNLCFQRFACYLKGGKPFFGREENLGCKESNFRVENERYVIGYPIIFASAKDDLSSKMWGKGGVAFLDDSSVGVSFGRIWKLSKEQYEQVRDQESRAIYDKEIILGYHRDGFSIKTITSSNEKKTLTKPSPSYIKTMTRGLSQTFGLSEKSISSYFENIRGYKN